jgi:hypothetical protein
MQSHSDIDLVRETWKVCQSLLPAKLAASLKAHAKDPAPLDKGATNIIRLRILPEIRQPLKFWSGTWCFYEIGAGSYARGPGEGLNLGGISFVQFPNQQVCGAGLYRQRVLQILNRLAATRQNDFTVQDATSIHLARRYLVQHRAFPYKIAGQDLAWLIAKSLPAFAALA